MASQKGFKRVFVTAIGDLRNTDVDGIGTLRFEGNAVYKWVKFSGTTAVAVGDPVNYVLSDGQLNTVDTAVSALPAGIAVSALTTAQALLTPYGWIQLSGVVTLSHTPSGTVAAGTPLTKSSTAGTLAAQTGVALFVGASIDGAQQAQIDFSY
jgi:hypothetical protein